MFRRVASRADPTRAGRKPRILRSRLAMGAVEPVLGSMRPVAEIAMIDPSTTLHRCVTER